MSNAVQPKHRGAIAHAGQQSPGEAPQGAEKRRADRFSPHTGAHSTILLIKPWLDVKRQEVVPGDLEPADWRPGRCARLRPPSHVYWFGTDAFGRDIYSRVMFGTRVSLTVGFSVALLASVAGLFIGLVSGSIRALDGLIMRIMDGMMSIPPILLAVALMTLTQAASRTSVGAAIIAHHP